MRSLLFRLFHSGKGAWQRHRREDNTGGLQRALLFQEGSLPLPTAHRQGPLGHLLQEHPVPPGRALALRWAGREAVSVRRIILSPRRMSLIPRGQMPSCGCPLWPGISSLRRVSLCAHPFPALWHPFIPSSRMHGTRTASQSLCCTLETGRNETERPCVVQFTIQQEKRR